ncbi:MAG: Gfo/Idh/MocA family oxidoreductase [Clostridia bacterium]|nr:Gfo/Idh/MocA family oxidoreductase [Clostridia bacterium]
MSNTVKMGIIGVGNMGSAHAKSLFAGNINGMELGAVCDIAKSKRKWANENLPGIPVFEDYKEMIASGLVDTILIATPHYLHPVIAIYGFEQGMNVLTEKPAGVYTKAVREMNEAAEKSGKVFGIMYNQRTNPKFQKMREIVQSGELGELKRCIWIITNWYRTQAYYDSGTWRATWAGEGGGALINQCPHNLDLWQWIFGMPNKISAHCKYGHWHNIEVEDEVTAYAEYPNGASGVFITTTGETPGTNRLEITGDRGKLVWEDGKLMHWKLEVPEREFCFTCEQGFAQPPMTVTEIEVDTVELGHNGILQNYANHILHGEPLLAPGYEGINGLSISNAIHLSDWTGKPQAIPVDEDLFLELLNERRATSKVKEEKEDEGEIADLSGTYNDRWKVR